MKRSAIIFFLLISFIGGITWFGNSLPELNLIKASRTYDNKSDYIWKLIVDFRRYSEWRENVYAVEQIPSLNAYEAWKEIDEDGITTPFQMLKYKKYTYVIMQETGDTHKKSGKWNFEIIENDDKTTTLLITETRLIPELLPRVINYFLHTSTVKIDAYFNSINNKIIGDDRRAKKEEDAPTI